VKQRVKERERKRERDWEVYKDWFLKKETQKKLVRKKRERERERKALVGNKETRRKTQEGKKNVYPPL